MSLLGVLGSRNRRGRTAQALDALLTGAGGEGTSRDLLVLPDQRIKRCRQCDADGWGLCRREGRCTIEDDFASLVQKMREADAAVFATPVYFSDLSESMRALLDRLRRICAHAQVRPDRLAGKPVLGICVAGGGGGGAPRCTVALERVLLDCGFDVVDMVPVRRQNLGLKKQVLRATGRWLAGQIQSSPPRGAITG